MDGNFSQGDAALSIIKVKPVFAPSEQTLAAAKIAMPDLLALAKNDSQRRHMEACFDFDSAVTLAIGPAGGGRTFISVLCAAALLALDVVDKIVITRPAVTAEENLGYLPGDEKEKLDGFMQPIYDTLKLLGLSKKLDETTLQLVSVGRMRGRTFHNAAIILDECQNTTPQQMKMIMGRIGVGSYLFANGDPDQCDLPQRRQPEGTWVQAASGLNFHLDGVKKALVKEALTHDEEGYQLPNQTLVVYDPAHMVRSEAASDMVNFYRNHCD